MAFFILLANPVVGTDLKSLPNIIVILADDLGWGDVSCNQPEHGKVRTPAIDQLAADGMRFTNAHAPHSVCTPTRYSLLTGRGSFHRKMKLIQGLPGQPSAYGLKNFDNYRLRVIPECG